MPIVQIYKDITTVEEGVIIHGCNAQGVMGSGVAKAIKDKWPGAYLAYRRAYQEYQQVKLRNLLGRTIWYEVNPHLFVVNAITQEFFGRDGKRYADLGLIETSIAQILEQVQDTELRNRVYIPHIGCGLGGLRWDEEVEPTIRNVLKSYDATIWVCVNKKPWQITQYHMHHGHLNNK